MITNQEQLQLLQAASRLRNDVRIPEELPTQLLYVAQISFTMNNHPIIASLYIFISYRNYYIIRNT
jgi:hypothetical protein